MPELGLAHSSRGPPNWLPQFGFNSFVQVWKLPVGLLNLGWLKTWKNSAPESISDGLPMDVSLIGQNRVLRPGPLKNWRFDVTKAADRTAGKGIRQEKVFAHWTGFRGSWG